MKNLSTITFLLGGLAATKAQVQVRYQIFSFSNKLQLTLDCSYMVNVCIDFSLQLFTNAYMNMKAEVWNTASVQKMSLCLI